MTMKTLVNQEVSMNKDYILANVTYKLVAMTDKIKDIPHKEFLDMAAVYRVAISDEGEQKVGGIIRQISNLSDCGITLKELDEAARRNTKAKGVTLIGMNEFLEEALGFPLPTIDLIPAFFHPAFTNA